LISFSSSNYNLINPDTAYLRQLGPVPDFVSQSRAGWDGVTFNTDTKQFIYTLETRNPTRVEIVSVTPITGEVASRLRVEGYTDIRTPVYDATTKLVYSFAYHEGGSRWHVISISPSDGTAKRVYDTGLPSLNANPAAAFDSQTSTFFGTFRREARTWLFTVPVKQPDRASAVQIDALVFARMTVDPRDNSIIALFPEFPNVVFGRIRNGRLHSTVLFPENQYVLSDADPALDTINNRLYGWVFPARDRSVGTLLAVDLNTLEPTFTNFTKPARMWGLTWW